MFSQNPKGPHGRLAWDGNPDTALPAVKQILGNLKKGDMPMVDYKIPAEDHVTYWGGYDEYGNVCIFFEADAP